MKASKKSIELTDSKQSAANEVMSMEHYAKIAKDNLKNGRIWHEGLPFSFICLPDAIDLFN